MKMLKMGWGGPKSLFLISAGTLCLEVLLTRLFSIFLWHHYAFFVVSLCLLGFGASGVALAAISKPSCAILKWSFCLFFVLAGVVTFSVSRVPFDPTRFGIDLSPFFWLSLLYLGCAVPFFFSGLFIGICLKEAPHHVGRLYAINLIGSAVGSLLSLLLLNLPLPATPSPYKPLRQALQFPQAQILETQWGPLGRVDLIESGMIRFAPGLSLRYQERLPDQLGITIDGGQMGAITRFDGEIAGLDFLTYLPSSAAFSLRPNAQVLLLQGGGGLGVLQALYYGGEITVLERNRDLVSLVAQTPLSGGLYQHPRVHHIAQFPRRYLEQSESRYDIISLSTEDIVSHASTGLHGLHEDYLLTTEAFAGYLAHLKAGGILSITFPLLFPPLETLRVINLAESSLKSLGLSVEGSCRYFESLETWTLLVKKDEFSSAEDQTLEAFISERDFSLTSLDSLRRSANRWSSVFDLEAPTDDRPFFRHFFGITRIQETYRLLEGRWEAFLEGGYLVYAALFIALFWGGLFLLGPAFLVRRGRWGFTRGSSLQACYFFCIGLAFISVEMALLQKSMFLSGNPTYGLALLLALVLSVSGLGSLSCHRLSRLFPPPLPFLILSGLLLVMAFLRGPLAVVLVSIPALFLMGLLFPLAFKRLDETEIPLAWASNGIASVLGAIGAVSVALEVGYPKVFLIAALLYLIAGLLFRFPPGPSSARIGHQ